MGNGFWLAVGQMCQMCFWTVRYLPQGGWRRLPRRTLTFGLAIPVLMIFQLFNWIFFMVDEIIFRRYRKVKIHQPIFITGIPRSGTTHLQRVLADHESVSSMRAWECFFAPSITGRYIALGLGRLLKPLQQMFSKSQIPFLKKMDSVHKLGLQEAEEDFITLININSCFLLVILFPEVRRYWRLGRFDHALSGKEKDVILNFYYRLIQKHMYFHGEGLRYLCKNPSFMTWIKSLHQRFPDASFVICEREASKAVSSQISSLQPAWQLIYGEDMDVEFSARIISMLAGYYHYLAALAVADINGLIIPMSELVEQLEFTVKKVLDHCQLECTEPYQAYLSAHVEQAQRYKSTHQYSKQTVTNLNEFLKLFPKQYVEQNTSGGLA